MFQVHSLRVTMQAAAALDPLALWCSCRWASPKLLLRWPSWPGGWGTKLLPQHISQLRWGTTVSLPCSQSRALSALC